MNIKEAWHTRKRACERPPNRIFTDETRLRCRITEPAPLLLFITYIPLNVPLWIYVNSLFFL